MLPKRPCTILKVASRRQTSGLTIPAQMTLLFKVPLPLLISLRPRPRPLIYFFVSTLFALKSSKDACSSLPKGLKGVHSFVHVVDVSAMYKAPPCQQTFIVRGNQRSPHVLLYVVASPPLQLFKNQQHSNKRGLIISVFYSCIFQK